MSPKPKPVPTPIVNMRVNTLFANADSITQTDARMAPTTVTVRQPHRFTNELDIGPVIKKKKTL